MNEHAKWLREQAANDFTCEWPLLEAADEIDLLEKYLGEANADEAKFRILWAEAKAENEKLRAALSEEEAATEALEAKLKSEGNCACSYDGVDDICMCHSPKLVAAMAENEKLKGAIAAAIKEARQAHYGDKFIQIDNFDDAILILEKALEG